MTIGDFNMLNKIASNYLYKVANPQSPSQFDFQSFSRDNKWTQNKYLQDLGIHNMKQVGDNHYTLTVNVDDLDHANLKYAIRNAYPNISEDEVNRLYNERLPMYNKMISDAEQAKATQLGVKYTPGTQYPTYMYDNNSYEDLMYKANIPFLTQDYKAVIPEWDKRLAIANTNAPTTINFYTKQDGRAFANRDGDISIYPDDNKYTPGIDSSNILFHESKHKLNKDIQGKGTAEGSNYMQQWHPMAYGGDVGSKIARNVNPYMVENNPAKFSSYYNSEPERSNAGGALKTMMVAEGVEPSYKNMKKLRTGELKLNTPLYHDQGLGASEFTYTNKNIGDAQPNQEARNNYENKQKLDFSTFRGMTSNTK